MEDEYGNVYVGPDVRDVEEAMATEFQVGDQVEFIGPLRGGTSVSIGDQGVVEEIQTNYQGSGLPGVRVRYTTGTYRGMVGYCDRYLTSERDNPCWALGAIRRVEGREVGEVTEAVRVEVERFGVGDRVRYTHTGGNDTPGIGAEGTVTRVDPTTRSPQINVRWETGERLVGQEYSYRVSWRGEQQYEIGCLMNLTAAEPQAAEITPSRVLINGDRVVYVGPANDPTHYNNPAYGTQGIVQGVHETRGEWGGTVRWEDANRNSWHYGASETSEWWLASALCHVDDWLDPDFPYRVGMRVNHRERPGEALTTWHEGTNGLWEGEILEIDREGGRIRVVHESDLRAAGAWWTRTGGNLNIEQMVPKEGQAGVGRREKKMISTCSLQAELEPAEKTALGRWIKGVLDNPTGDNRFPNSLQDKIAVCYQGQLRLLREERWMESPPYLYLGRADRLGERVNVPVSHRLAVAMTLMQMVEPTEELKGAARAALGRYLLGEYQELSKGVVVISKKKPEGLAFSADKVAAKIGDEWVLPTTGEPVKVDGGEWTICSM